MLYVILYLDCIVYVITETNLPNVFLIQEEKAKAAVELIKQMARVHHVYKIMSFIHMVIIK